MDSGSAERHNPFHEFFDIELPGRVIVHTVLSGNGERDAVTSARGNNPRSNEPAPISQTSASVPAPAPVTHNAFCDLCDSRITGDRYVGSYSCYSSQCSDFAVTEMSQLSGYVIKK
jgi:next to BRCA1 gene 1 protein